jgi:hypothetical protein
MALISTLPAVLTPSSIEIMRDIWFLLMQA